MSARVLKNPGQLHEVFKNCPDHLATQVPVMRPDRMSTPSRASILLRKNSDC